MKYEAPPTPKSTVRWSWLIAWLICTLVSVAPVRMMRDHIGPFADPTLRTPLIEGVAFLFVVVTFGFFLIGAGYFPCARRE
jgi:hypothetical protein